MHASTDFPIVVPLCLHSMFIFTAFVRVQIGLYLLHHNEDNLLSSVVDQLHRQ